MGDEVRIDYGYGDPDVIPDMVLADTKPFDKESSYFFGDLEELLVDPEYVLKYPGFAGGALLTRLRQHLMDSARHGEYITYKEIADICRDNGLFNFEPGVMSRTTSKQLTLALTCLWRAGWIRKFRRGRWRGRKKSSKSGFGITYWVW